MAATDLFGVRLANDIVHDCAAAVVLAAPYSSVVLLGVAATKTASVTGLGGAAWRLLGYAVLAFVLLVVTGAVRLRYAQAQVEEAARPARTKGALLKHAAFALLILGGFAVCFMVATRLAG